MAGVDGLVFGIFVLGLVLVALRVGYLWARERRNAPHSGERPKIPLRPLLCTRRYCRRNRRGNRDRLPLWSLPAALALLVS